jgi:hypothetical protein
MAAYDDVRNVSKCNMRIETVAPTTLTNIDEFYQIQGTFFDGLCKDFLVATNGTITYSGPNGRRFIFAGVSDLKVNKVCQITYALKVNGVINEHIQTPHDFAMADRLAGVSIIRWVDLFTGDYMQIFAKSDTAAVVLTAQTLFLVFIGEN